jgi:molecular chaperone GrpE
VDASPDTAGTGEQAAKAAFEAMDPTSDEALRQQIAEADSRAMRAHAELENYRKRANRQIDEERKYAVVPLIRDLLPVIDNLQRALQHAEEVDHASGLRDGVEMVAQSLVAVLAKHHCTQIQAEGQPFDPHLHEAIAQFPNDTVPQGHVAEVTSIGYQLFDRVVRPSQVLVSTGPAEN